MTSCIFAIGVAALMMVLVLEALNLVLEPMPDPLILWYVQPHLLCDHTKELPCMHVDTAAKQDRG